MDTPKRLINWKKALQRYHATTFQRTERKHNYNRREHKQIGNNPLAKTKTSIIEPIGFVGWFSTDTERKNAINELEMLAVVWGLEHFRLHIYGKPIEFLTDHEALESLKKKQLD